MQIKIITAKSDNNVIGKDNELVWNLPADYQFFTQNIAKGLLLTGRKSFESPLGKEVFENNPRVLVLTRQQDYNAPPAITVDSIETAIAYAKKNEEELLWILGGTSVYNASMNLVDEIVTTEVHGIFEGDSHFPDIDPAIWTEVSREDHQKDADNPYDYSFVVYRRQ